jgi:hypothetical protein
VTNIIERGSARNTANSLQSCLKRLSDDNLKQLIEGACREQKRRQGVMHLIHEERNRWRYQRGLTKTDTLFVMRRHERSWGLP